MLLESITLENFRQYFGRQVIEFSQSSSRNVTIIHGENGSGKTALLNAFNWCLYEKLDLPNPEHIINEYALDTAAVGGVVTSKVVLRFSDNKKKYILTRMIHANKTNTGMYLSEPETILEFKNNGQSETIQNPTIEINRIIPENLRSYFFFDGERIDNLSKEEGTDDIKDAIKTMMGLEVLERAKKHTETARRRFLDEMKKFGDAETVHLIDQEMKLENEKEKIQEELKQRNDNLKILEKQIKEKENRLKQIEGAKYLQERRDQKNDELARVRNDLRSKRKEITEIMSKKGYLAFSFSPLQEAQSKLDNYKGGSKKVVTGLTSSFINELLASGNCICGEKLEKGSSHYAHVEELLNYLAPISLDAAITNYKSDTKILDLSRKQLFLDLKRLKEEESNYKAQERKLDEEIQEISANLSEKDSEEIVEIENARLKLISQKSETDREIGKLQSQLEKIEMEISKIRSDREKIEKRADKVNLAQKRIDVCESLVKAMEEIYTVREKIVKSNLQERIANVYSQFLRKDYKINLNENYELNVLNANNKVVGMSQGERQITSLSFIGAIVDIAREQHKKENKNAFEDGGIYPLVMDSPFGALDSDHRERIAKGIHKLADQVVVIVSTSQWRGEVEEQMKNLIGKEYNLQYNDPRINKDKPYEYTEVIEVKKGV